MITARQLRDEMNKLINAGRGDVPVHIGDHECIGILWLKESSEQEMDVTKAHSAMIEYS